MTDAYLEKKMLTRGYGAARKECALVLGYALRMLSLAGVPLEDVRLSTHDLKLMNKAQRIALGKGVKCFGYKQTAEPVFDDNCKQDYARLEINGKNGLADIYAEVSPFAESSSGGGVPMTEMKVNISIAAGMEGSPEFRKIMRKLCRPRLLGGHGYKAVL